VETVAARPFGLALEVVGQFGTMWPDLLQRRQRLLSIRRWRSSGFSLPSGPRRSEILLVLLPGLALLALVVGAAFFWSLFLDWLFMLDFNPLAF